jgi:hypothetical protein
LTQEAYHGCQAPAVTHLTRHPHGQERTAFFPRLTRVTISVVQSPQRGQETTYSESFALAAYQPFPGVEDFTQSMTAKAPAGIIGRALWQR